MFKPQPITAKPAEKPVMRKPIKAKSSKTPKVKQARQASQFRREPRYGAPETRRHLKLVASNTR